ncbi:SDR family oxidoreductase [Candidatus Shapirobacteria bacterium]|nr:SDR family oxidoreductase [Candidatus Shapirobacteria bacterium]
MAKENEHNTILIFGGSSGLGLELGKLLATRDNTVYVTGRREPKDQPLRFVYLDVDQYTDQLSEKIDKALSNIQGSLDLLVLAAGFYQEGTISQLSDADIRKMINVGLTAPIVILNKVLNRQERLPGVIAITSTSQWTPRTYEPVYTAVKAGLGMLANSVSLDPQVGKVLVAGPAGMKTNFWLNTEKDTTTMLDPRWVAERIIELYSDGAFKYKYARILREPPRVEMVEER